ncbi:hypothetical protein FJU30_19945 [Affinibrenneria salicis]|uniref:DKNYY family protein n=1 Tax=Affinibrenneria salicis TaxID=2590031 RepID=A0A5J5FVU4_9GAMM|nr:DKNYY domain-containing protein [Affinibrenneria salicis]KAA8996930.1 hypothetical protein FJU30_19945 [Affinibrenneria salicis]
MNKVVLAGLLAAMGVGAYCAAAERVAASEQTPASGSKVKYPYKVINDRVVYQKAANLSPQPLADASPDDFERVYKNDEIALGKSNGHYYCNDTKLPAGFDLATGATLDVFLFSNVGTFASCKPMAEKVDRDKFNALDFPFFSDGQHIFLRDGEVLAGADAASFQPRGMNQAFDKQHYYFMEGDSVRLPYRGSVNIYAPCWGWANIDGALYYRGEKQNDVDVKTFQCLAFTLAADKKGFYIYGKPYPIFAPDVKLNNIKPLSAQVFSDGKYSWHVGVEPTLLEGINSKALKVDGRVISDGVSEWYCADVKTGDEPTCHKNK